LVFFQLKTLHLGFFSIKNFVLGFTIKNFVLVFAIKNLTSIMEIDNKKKIYIYIKSKGIYQPENLMSNGSSRHDHTAQTTTFNKRFKCDAFENVKDYHYLL
jgi:nitrous oxide reductase